ncbi:hypothetical protein RB597_007426 [Gaeumannomyces tritici]
MGITAGAFSIPKRVSEPNACADRGNRSYERSGTCYNTRNGGCNPPGTWVGRCPL